MESQRNSSNRERASRSHFRSPIGSGSRVQSLPNMEANKRDLMCAYFKINIKHMYSNSVYMYVVVVLKCIYVHVCTYIHTYI